VDSLKLSFAESGGILRELAGWIGKGDITPPQVEIVPLEEAPQAYANILAGTTRLKQVIRF
jgi:NADPH-dependent curcumin reductase CurA